MLAELGRLGLDERTRRPRKQDLTTVPSRGDPRCKMYVLADVPLGCEMARAGVEAHADANRAAREGCLTRCRCEDRRSGGRERDEEGVALVVDFDTIFGRECFTKHTTMIAEQLGVALGPNLMQQLRRGFDIREEQRHLAVRQVSAHAADDAAGERRRIDAVRRRAVLGRRWRFLSSAVDLAG